MDALSVGLISPTSRSMEHDGAKSNVNYEGPELEVSEVILSDDSCCFTNRLQSVGFKKIIKKS